MLILLNYENIFYFGINNKIIVKLKYKIEFFHCFFFYKKRVDHVTTYERLIVARQFIFKITIFLIILNHYT